jgi:hypothetical protein
MERIMAVYSFVTTWHFDAPIEQVWQSIRNYQAWSSWWPSIAEARQIAPGDTTGVGESVEFAFRTRLPYQLRCRMTTVRIVEPRELDGRAEGELQGRVDGGLSQPLPARESPTTGMYRRIAGG